MYAVTDPDTRHLRYCAIWDRSCCSTIALDELENRDLQNLLQTSVDQLSGFRRRSVTQKTISQS
jgi:hypothetical protein